MEKAAAAIVDAACLPLSIIIVGIGNADFGKMEYLDGDNGLVDSAGRKAKRDLVQFVPFNKFKGKPSKLAESVLEELPMQLCEYMRMVGIKPDPPQMVDINNLKFSMGGTNNNNWANLGQNLVNAGFLNNIINQEIGRGPGSNPMAQNNMNPNPMGIGNQPMNPAPFGISQAPHFGSFNQTYSNPNVQQNATNVNYSKGPGPSNSAGFQGPNGGANMGYGQQNLGYGQQNVGYEQQNMGYGQQNFGYAPQSARGLGQNTMAFGQNFMTGMLNQQPNQQTNQLPGGNNVLPPSGKYYGN